MRHLYRRTRLNANQSAMGHEPVGLGVLHPSGLIATRGIATFVHRVSELNMHINASDLGMGHYSPRMVVVQWISAYQQ